MKIKTITAIAALSLFLAQAAAAIKTGNNGVTTTTVLGDGLEFSAGSVGQEAGAGGTVVDGALGGVAYGILGEVTSGSELESGFYSRMVIDPALGLSAVNTSSYTVAFGPVNPQGTSYDVFVSTWASADRYMVYYTTTADGLPVETLYPNTSFYNYVLANYMDGDYSGYTSNTAVTLATRVASADFRFSDVGHNTLNLSFSAFGNPGPLENSGWAAAQAMPAAAVGYGQASVIYGSHVFVSGGFDGVYASSAVYRAEIGAAGPSNWQPAGFMQEALYGHQMVAARGRLYILGGHTQGSITSLVWSADISSAGVLSAWEAEAPLGLALYFHAAAVAGKWLHISGGYTGSGVSQQVRSASLNEAGVLSAWGNDYNLPAPRYAHSMTYLADRLYVIGGKDGATAKSDVWRFRLGADGKFIESGQDYASLPVPRFGHTALAAGNALYVIGGNGGSTAQQTVFISTAAAAVADSGPWTAAAPLGAARQYASGAVRGDRLYVFGGYSGSSPQNTVYISTASGTRYLVEVSSDVLFAVDTRTSGWMSGYNWSFGALTPGITYNVRAKARNRLGVETAYSQTASTITYAAVPGTAAWSNVSVTSATANWLPNGNPSGAIYEILYTSYSAYQLGNTAIVPASDITNLLPNTTYYAKVRVASSPGGPSRFIDLPTVFTSFDPAQDSSSPTVTVAMSPAAMSWRSTNTFGCDVNLYDSGISDAGLDRFEVRSSTALNDAGGAWTPHTAGINQGSYTQDWAIPQAVWELMLEGASNYISLRVIDRADNTTTYLDAFSVLKDTTPPVIVSTYVAPSGMLTDDPGAAGYVTGLSFADALSGLYRAQYSISLNSLNPDAEIVGWTAISTPTLAPGATSYAPTLIYNFAQLANAPSNYFSLRAIDMAGSTYTLTSVFAIGKNVSGPGVVIANPAPASLFLSTFSQVSGNTAMTNAHPVRGSEVSLLDVTAGKYYTGSAFIAGSRVWFEADDTANTFSYAFADLPLVGGNLYQVVARSSDSVGDYSQNFATHTFRYDIQAPDTLVVTPADASVYSGASFSGTAADTLAGLSTVFVAVKRISDGKWWDGGVYWGNTIPTVTATGTADWTYTLPAFLRDYLANGASYYITARASDLALPQNAGNFSVSGSTFTYSDITPPAQTSSVWASESGQRGAVRLSWKAVGDNGAGGFLPSGEFRIVYSTFPGAAVSTAAPSVTISTAALTAGSTQSRLVTGLDPGASYYFTLWTADDVPNWSPASAEVLGLASVLNSGGITGSVADASTQPITGVLIEALGPTGAVEGSDFTDAFGNFAISDLSSDILSVRAVWSAQDIESSVSKDEVGNGAGGVNFRLSVSYQLAAISGLIPSGFMPRHYSTPSGARYTTREVRPAQNQPFAEIYRKGRRIGAAFVDANGAFEVPNLLPATYGVRVYNGSDFSKMETVTLRPGERFLFTPKFELLNKDRVYAYPNPANTQVNFHFEPSASAFEAEVEVFDITGRLIKTLKGAEADTTVGGGTSRIPWDFSREGVGSGVYVYILRIKDAAGAAAKPVVKKFAIIR